MPGSIVRGLVVIVIIMVFTFLLFLLAYSLSNFGEQSGMSEFQIQMSKVISIHMAYLNIFY